MELDKTLSAMLEHWQYGQAPAEEIRKLASELGNRHYEPGISVLLQLLRHEDELVRYNAITSLAFEFHYLPASDELLKMTAQDNDADCRRVAAAAIGNLQQNTNDRRVLTVLAERALTDPDEYVRSSAYKALQIVRGVTREEHLKLLRDERLEVDPARIHRILEEQ
jgi:HEAT repeat protein